MRRNVELPWNEIDLRGAAYDEREEQVDALLAGSRRRHFALARPPLMRFDLARTAEAEWLFVWTCHHLVVDGWCLGIVLREVFSCYEQLRRGMPVALASCGTFGDYLTWLAAQDATSADRFWANELAGLGPTARLPLGRLFDDHRSPATGHGECELRLSQADTSRLAELALGQRVSRSALVKAAWAILLARYLDCEDVVFGVTVSGRPPQVPLVETIVGPLANNVPLRVRVALDDSLADLFARLSRQQLETQPFEYCPLAQIAGAAGRSGGRVFDTLVVYENYPLHDADRLELGDVTIRDMHGTTTSSYPLSLVALPGRQLVLRMLFDGRHYSANRPATSRADGHVATRHGRPTGSTGARFALAHVGPVDLSSEQSDSAKESGLVVRVLDSAGQPAPIEMPGELWTGTTGVTQLRTTGYRACRCQDGTIEYLGPGVSAFDRRMSDAASLSPIVRVGRFSVDTAEVAAILRLHPLVADLAVAGFADHERATQLAAYVVPNQQGRVAIESVEHGLLLAELRRFLAERVPESMIPTAWRSRPTAARRSGECGPGSVTVADSLAQRVACAVRCAAMQLRSAWQHSGPRCWVCSLSA